jgi:hypothetical protein
MTTSFRSFLWRDISIAILDVPADRAGSGLELNDNSKICDDLINPTMQTTTRDLMWPVHDALNLEEQV